jgi:putative tryptophan/tyrosine transport system substrate-binding protein
MRRRDFIKFLVGGTIGWFGVATAQSAALPVIGYLSTLSPESEAKLLVGFQKGLGEAGYVDKRNVSIDYRWSKGQYDAELSAMARDLVERRVSVIVAISPPAALAAKAATSTIPVVFLVGTDPVSAGLVTSWNKPGGNATGVDILVNTLEAKRVGLLHEMLPRMSKIAVMINPTFTAADQQSKDIETAAHLAGVQAKTFPASTVGEIESTFHTIEQGHFPGLLIAADPFFLTSVELESGLATKYKLPTISEFRQFPITGGLMSYGIDLVDVHRQVGFYAGRILKGDKPADLPVSAPTKFELVINLRTAKLFGLTVPPNLLALADEVIE